MFTVIKKTALLLIILFATLHAYAQPKLTAVTQSELTGVTLPNGTKQDKRALYVSAAKILLESVAKKHSTTLKNTEVLYLQPQNGTVLTATGVKPILEEKGWKILPVQDEPDYLWLEQNGKHVLTYIAATKKQTNVYFAEVNKTPVINAGSVTTQSAEPVVQQIPAQQPQAKQEAPAAQTNNITTSNSFTYTNTNFDDGWTSQIKKDWVEVTKPGIKILIHYPNAQADKHNFNKLEGDNNAWNILVAPRYSSITNFSERGIQDFQSITFLTADAVTTDGKNVHIILYKKHYDKGNGRFLEVVADSKAIFEKEFGSSYINRSSWDYLEQTKTWDKLAAMQWRNKFAVTAADVIGKWSASDYASLSYYYVNTGGFAGATATSISDEFTFLQGNKYQSDHAGASGVVGNQKFSRQVYNGSSTVTNWSITLTNRFQGAAEKYDCHFEAVKGGRILLLTDRLGTSMSLVKAK